MKSRLTNNLSLKIIAVLFSAFLWLMVVNVSDPIETKRFYSEVGVVNPEVVTSRGMTYQLSEDSKTVLIMVKAERSVLEKIKPADIVATADFKELQNNFVPVRIKINGFEGRYEEASATPRNVQIKTEDTEKKTFPLTPVTTGSLQQGYVVGKLTAEPQSIDISGPMSSVGRINKVIAKVDVSELSEDTVLKAELIYYDSAENVIDKSLLTSNVDIKGVNVNVEVMDTKKVELIFDRREIRTAEGYAVTGLEIEPQYITVAGDKERLDGMEYIEIGSSALKQEGLTENREVVVDIAQYLPKDLSLSDAATGSVVVNILVDKAGEKSITIPVRSVTVNNVPPNMELSYGPEQDVELRFQGSDEVLAGLTNKKIAASIDLKDYKKEGTYSVPVRIASLPEGCTYSEDSVIQIILKKKP